MSRAGPLEAAHKWQQTKQGTSWEGRTRVLQVCQETTEESLAGGWMEGWGCPLLAPRFLGFEKERADGLK